MAVVAGLTTVNRQLCTIARFHKYAVEEELLDFPAAHVRHPRLGYESHATTLNRNLAPILSPPGSAAR